MHICIHENSRCRHKGLWIALQNVLWGSLTLKTFHMIRVTLGLLIVPLLANKKANAENYLFPSCSYPAFVGALHRSAFESLQIGKSPSSYVYENTSFQRACSEFIFGPSCAVRLTPWQRAPPQAFHRGLSPLVSSADWLIFSLMTSCVGHGLGLQEWIGHAGPALFCYAHLRCCKVRHLPFLWPERMTCSIIKRTDSNENWALGPNGRWLPRGLPGLGVCKSEVDDWEGGTSSWGWLSIFSVKVNNFISVSFWV